MHFFTESEVGKNLVLILISILVGLMIGSEREYRNKSAGLRTFILVSFGSCVFTILSLKIGTANPDRLAANILTGIGFLGAGVIFKDENKVAGITTATTIWATAALGVAVGSGNIFLGILGALLVLVILNALYFLQVYIDNSHKIRAYQLVVPSVDDIEYCLQMFKDFNLKFELLSESNTDKALSVTYRVSGNNRNHLQLIDRLRKDSVITSYQF